MQKTSSVKSPALWFDPTLLTADLVKVSTVEVSPEIEEPDFPFPIPARILQKMQAAKNRQSTGVAVGRYVLTNASALAGTSVLRPGHRGTPFKILFDWAKTGPGAGHLYGVSASTFGVLVLGAEPGGEPARNPGPEPDPMDLGAWERPGIPLTLINAPGQESLHLEVAMFSRKRGVFIRGHAKGDPASPFLELSADITGPEELGSPVFTREGLLGLVIEGGQRGEEAWVRVARLDSCLPGLFFRQFAWRELSLRD